MPLFNQLGIFHPDWWVGHSGRRESGKRGRIMCKILHTQEMALRLDAQHVDEGHMVVWQEVCTDMVCVVDDKACRKKR